MIVKFMIEKPKMLKVAVRDDMTSVPQKGDHIVLSNDKDYIVTYVGWDLTDMNNSVAVVGIKLMKKKVKSNV